MPRLYPASIEVTQEGIPLAEATVALIPVDPGLDRWGPAGITNASGVVVLQTNGLYTGAPLGTYKVVVSKTSIELHPNPELENAEMGSADYEKYRQLDSARMEVNYVEPQYSSMENTPLTIEVVAGQKAYSVDAGKQVQVKERRRM